MPLASRATANRAERAAAAKTGAEQVQPRRPAEAATKPAPEREPDAPPTSEPPPGEGELRRQEEAPPTRQRKPRADKGTTRPKASVPVTENGELTVAGMKARQREIEGEVIAKRKALDAEIAELQKEHQQLAVALSKAVFS